MKSDPIARRVDGSGHRPGNAIEVPIRFHPDVFEVIRKRAIRERSSFGEVVTELVERALGG